MILMTATGTTVEVEWYGRSDIDRNLYIGAKNITPADAVNIFTNPKQTKALTVFRDEQNMEDETTLAEWYGFTRFAAVRINDLEGTVIVSLGREEAGE